MERIKLNLIPSGVAPVVHLSQYDEGRKFGIDLFEGDSVYVLDGTETLTVNSRKPDGHVVVISVTNTGTSSLEVETVEQLTAVHGTSYAKLKIEKGSVTIATLEFLIAVSRDPLENGDPSESFVDNLNTQISNAVADQYDSNNVIFDNDPTTGHGIGYTVTSEGIKNAIDNAIGGLSIPDELNDLSDVDISGQALGEALVWNGTKWVNGTPELDVGDLNDVTITTPSNGDIIVYNNGVWINVANPASTANFAPDYDDTATYNTNDKVIYNNLLYICLEDSVTGAWDSTKWQQISTADYNASNTPISANDPTDTKTYIDTGLSGKQNTISDSGWINLPLASGVSNYGDNVSQYRKIGNVVYYYILVEKSGLVWGSQVATLPTGYRPNQEATSSGRYGNGICNFSVATNGSINFLASTNTSTTDYRFFACGSFCI